VVDRRRVNSAVRLLIFYREIVDGNLNMKRLATYAFLAAILCSLTLARSQTADVTTELANVDLKLNDSLYGKGDLTLLDDLLADDWSGTTALGVTYAKAEMLAEIRKGKGKLDGKKPPDVLVSPVDVKIHLHGDTAVVSGVLRLKMDGRTLTPANYVNVYIRRHRRWYAVATHYFSRAQSNKSLDASGGSVFRN
jgi:hypothetical protein